MSRATSRLNAGTGAEAVAEIAKLTKLPNWSGADLCNFACVYAVASGKIAEFADRAMELLRKTVKAGYKDVAQLQQDKDIDPLRERDDFKKLLAELQKKLSLFQNGDWLRVGEVPVPLLKERQRTCRTPPTG